MPGLQIGLNLPKKSSSSSAKPAPAKRKPIFGEDDEEDPELSTNSISKSGDLEDITAFDEDVSRSSNDFTALSQSTSTFGPSKPALKPKFPSNQHSETSPNLSTLRSQKQQTADVDPSLYDYDAAYDALHASQSRSKGTAASGASTSSGQGHMEDLLAAAETRKRDQLRAKERMLQKEREAEGEEFKDKDTFVTEAYKAQQEEVKKAEELEKQKEQKEDERRRQGMGMSNFYKGFMEQEEKKHQEMVEAAAKSSISKPHDNESKDNTPKEQSDLELARELKTRGKDVHINEEGQIIDKRELLSAGLNVAPKPQAGSTANSTQSSNVVRKDGMQQSGRDRGHARKAMRERQSRMMEEQLEQAAKRAAEDEATEREKLERAAKSRKTEADISSAKERYLQRKREAAAAAALEKK